MKKRKILQPYLDATPSVQKALQQARNRATEQRALQQARTKAAAASQRALQQASANKNEHETETFQEKRRREIDALKMDSYVFGKILNSSSTSKSKGRRK
jgi:hypothetical protein